MTIAATASLLWHAVPIGIGATVLMDVWTGLRKRIFHAPSLDYALVGRWIGHMAHGRFRHESIAAALDRIAQLDLLDDRVFADAYVQARAGRGRGPGRLQRDLNALGVEPDAIRAALQSLSENSDLDPWQHTLEQGRRRAAAMARLPHTTQVRRLTAFFARRGFHGEEARETIDQLIGAAGEH